LPLSPKRIDMYFSNVIVYQVTRDIGLGEDGATDKLSEQLKEFAFCPCGSQDLKKMGWVSPLHAFDAEDMILAGSGRILLTLKREEKILPSASVKKELDKKVKAVESAEARKVGKKEKDMFKDEIIQELLPRCLTKESFLSGYLALGENILVIDSTSSGQAEEFCALLRKTLGSLPVVPLQSNSPYETTMTTWLQEQAHPDGFTVDHDAKLESIVKDGGKVTFKDEDLFSDEVLAHVEADKVVREIRLSSNETVSFTLTDGFQLKRLKWAEELKAKNDDVDLEDAAARMDADFALMAGELDKVLLQLFDVMKVERQKEGEQSQLQQSPGVELLSDDVDGLYLESVAFVVETRRASVSSIQRKFKIGYNRAARIIELMESNGIVSTPGHNGMREVFQAPK